MTLSSEQWDKIFSGIEDMGLATTILDGQYINEPQRPLIILQIVSEGLQVTEKRIKVGDIEIPGPGNKVLRRETYGQICKARITAFAEALDIASARSLVIQLATRLDQEELRVCWPIDQMQYRGCEPVTHLPPYRSERLKKLIQRFAVDFFVEYWHVFTVDHWTIREFVLEYGEPPDPYFHGVDKGELYSLDVIISR